MSPTLKLKVFIALIQMDGTWAKEIMALDTGKNDMDIAMLEVHKTVTAWFKKQQQENPLALSFHIYRVLDDRGGLITGQPLEAGEFTAPGTYATTIYHYFIIKDDYGLGASEPYKTEEEMEAALIAEMQNRFHCDAQDDLYIAQLTSAHGLEIWTDNFRKFELCQCGHLRRSHDDDSPCEECECEEFVEKD